MSKYSDNFFKIYQLNTTILSESLFQLLYKVEEYSRPCYFYFFTFR